jgi:Protein of unknown function (DUF723)
MPYKNSEEFKKRALEQTLKNIEKRGHPHTIVSRQYETKQSPLIVWCPKHFHEHVTTFTNYNRSQTGCPCCGKDRVSQKLSNRQYSEETLRRMSLAARERPLRGGKPRRWRNDFDYLKWRGKVFQRFDFKCAITGISKEQLPPGNLVVHHLNCANHHPRYNCTCVPENGIVLIKELHVAFHNQYGYGKNTVLQFQSFLLSLIETQKSISKPISSQTNSEGLEGSETRAYDPNRVMELHECLGRISLL